MKQSSIPPAQQACGAAGQSAAKPAMPTAGASRSQPVTPKPEWSEPQPSSHQNLGIEPIASKDNDASLSFDWRPVDLSSNRSCACAITTTTGHALTVTIDQPPYQKTLHGTGSVQTVALPPGPDGTKGRLIARDETTGASAEFTWQWQPVGAAGRAKPSKLWRNIASAKPAKRARSAPGTSTASGVMAGTAFFGQQTYGQRFAFILDMSGSMVGPRWELCTRELKSALEGLTEEAEFFVVLFSDRVTEPPGQAGWTVAKRGQIADVIDWIASYRPNGGTYPRPAFERVFSLRSPPDAVYFLTDGDLQSFTAAECARIRDSGGRSKVSAFLSRVGRLLSFGVHNESSTIINTIALDLGASSSIMQEIAAETGGQYIEVSSTGTS